MIVLHLGILIITVRCFRNICTVSYVEVFHNQWSILRLCILPLGILRLLCIFIMMYIVEIVCEQIDPTKKDPQNGTDKTYCFNMIVITMNSMIT